MLKEIANNIITTIKNNPEPSIVLLIGGILSFISACLVIYYMDYEVKPVSKEWKRLRSYIKK